MRTRRWVLVTLGVLAVGSIMYVALGERALPTTPVTHDVTDVYNQLETLSATLYSQLDALSTTLATRLTEIAQKLDTLSSQLQVVAARASAQKWEYMIRRYTTEEMMTEEEFGYQGLIGWELVGSPVPEVGYCGGIGECTIWTAVWKRPVTEAPRPAYDLQGVTEGVTTP